MALLFIIPDFPNPNIRYSFFFTPIIHYLVFITQKKKKDTGKLLGSFITSPDIPKREILEAVLM